MPKNHEHLSVSIVVPTRNEAPNLPAILELVKAYADELIVVDGNSKDSTREIALQYGANVLLDRGLGKGDALRLAGSKASSDIILFIDADWSHNPNDIPLLLAPILNGDADHVSGSRMLGGSDELFSSVSEFIRLVGSEVITLTIGKRYGIRLTDTQNGFRCLRKDVFMSLDLRENITTIEQEMVVETLRRGYRLVEVPAHEYRRNAGTSSIQVWKVGFRYVYCLVKNILKPVLRKLPSNMAEIQEKYRPRWSALGLNDAHSKKKNSLEHTDSSTSRGLFL
jgi:glycosyltransferase involved in cell wall biosynthesis